MEVLHIDISIDPTEYEFAYPTVSDSIREIQIHLPGTYEWREGRSFSALNTMDEQIADVLRFLLVCQFPFLQIIHVVLTSALTLHRVRADVDGQTCDTIVCDDHTLSAILWTVTRGKGDFCNTVQVLSELRVEYPTLELTLPSTLEITPTTESELHTLFSGAGDWLSCC